MILWVKGCSVPPPLCFTGLRKSCHLCICGWLLARACSLKNGLQRWVMCDYGGLSPGLMLYDLSLSLSINLSLSFFISLYLSLFLSISLYFSLSLFISHYLTLFLSIFLYFSLSLSLCLCFSLSHTLTASIELSVPHCLFSLFFFLSLSVYPFFRILKALRKTGSMLIFEQLFSTDLKGSKWLV